MRLFPCRYESRLGALADLELALRIKSLGPSLGNEDFMVVAGDMLFQVPKLVCRDTIQSFRGSSGEELDYSS